MLCLVPCTPYNKDHQQCLLSLVVQTGNINFLYGQGTNAAYNQCDIKENYHMKSKLAQKLYDENVWHVNIKTKRNSVLCVLFKFCYFYFGVFYCFTSWYVPNMEAKSVVLELTTRAGEHCIGCKQFWIIMERVAMNIFYKSLLGAHSNCVYQKDTIIFNLDLTCNAFHD